MGYEVRDGHQAAREIFVALAQRGLVQRVVKSGCPAAGWRGLAHAHQVLPERKRQASVQHPTSEMLIGLRQRAANLK